MRRMIKHLDAGSLLVIATTLFLFIAALLFKGLTHDLLLETGVFLVSVKLIIMSYKSAVVAEKTHAELREIRSLLHRSERSDPPRVVHEQMEASGHERG